MHIAISAIPKQYSNNYMYLYTLFAWHICLITISINLFTIITGTYNISLLTYSKHQLTTST